MTKSDLVQRIARQFPGISRQDARVMVDLFLEGMKKGLMSGGYRGTPGLRSATSADTRSEKVTQSKNGSVRHGRREKDRLLQAESDIKKAHEELGLVRQ